MRHFFSCRFPKAICLLGFLLAAVRVAGAAEVESMPRLPLLAESPRIDGSIETVEWGEALELPAFGEGKITTKVWIAVANGSLHIAVRCQEPQPGQMKIQTIADEKKGAVWNDDSVELFVDLTNTGQSIFHLVCNPEGTFYDGEIIRLQHTPSAWESQAQVRAKIFSDRWEAEIAIPMESMGHELQRGEVIAVNIGRNRHVRGGRAERSSLASGRAFLEPDRFVRLLAGGTVDAGGISFVSLRRGPFFKNEPGAWEFLLLGERARLDKRLFFPGARKPPVITRKGQSVVASFEGRDTKTSNECQVRWEKETLYHSRYKLRASQAAPARVSVTGDPLFESLLEPNPQGLSKKGIMTWPHEIDRVERKKLPLRTGVAFDPDDPYRHYAEEGAILLFQTKTLHNNNRAILEKTAKYNIPVMIWITHRAAARKGAPVIGVGKGNYPCWHLDPRAIEAYLDDARLAIELSREFPNIQWLHSGDETWESMHRRLLYFLDHREGYPEFAAADREVREKFGFGKYGFPESSKDDNPYRWIATSRWEIASMIGVEKQVKAMIEHDAPHLKLVSWDSMDGHHPYGLRRWGEVFDVITGQLYPSRNADLEDFSFYTKLYADLTGAKEIWPVPHVESYAARFTPEETEEFLSQVFRGGATGLHLYLADTRAERAAKANPVVDRIGAPERWNVISSVTRRLREQPFRVRQPEPDTAIFYSNTSYQGQEGNALKRHHSGEVQWIYTILGPRLRSALRFVDDLLCQEAPGDLARYKAIYVPYAPIADDAEYQALQAYVEKGGNLIICDPMAFRHRSDGSARDTGALLPPLASLEPLPRGRGALQFTEPALEVEVADPSYPLGEGGGTVMATGPGGAPAVIERSVGEGKVFLFGGNPLRPSSITNAHAIALFKYLQTKAGAVLNQEVWRFRFPRTPPLPIARPGKVCLTGNYFEWVMNEPKPAASAAVRGSYRLSAADTRSRETAGVDIPFGEGRLTDRLKGSLAPGKTPPDQFTLAWKMERPLEIVYRFDRPVVVETLRMFHAGLLPAGRCEISVDGGEWLPQGSWKEQTAAAEAVRLEQLALDGPQKAAYLKLVFEPAEGRLFTLVETDLWGREE